MYKHTRSRGFKRRGSPRGGFRGNVRGKYINPARFVHKPSDSISEELYTPGNSFSDFNLRPILYKNIVSKGYTQPTPIQDQTIPYILDGKDVIGIANTGTGKTAAFLIPLISNILLDNQIKILVIAPTRELALQIQEEFRLFTGGTSASSVLTIGGTNMQNQKGRLRRHFNIVVATPGRLLDHVKQRSIDLSQFSRVVLDEVDRMVDIGFIHDVKRIVSLLPQKRQSMFFSATIGRKEEEILRSFVTNPIKVEVKKTETAENIEQDVVRVSAQSNKIDTLHDILIQEEVKKVLIFGRTKWSVDKLSKNLVERGFKAGTIHGGKPQGHRQRVLESFRNNRISILTATDVASRGIDVDDITHVINFDIPESWEDYVHRIGRTGRANKKGKALTFLE